MLKSMSLGKETFCTLHTPKVLVQGCRPVLARLLFPKLRKRTGRLGGRGAPGSARAAIMNFLAAAPPAELCPLLELFLEPLAGAFRRPAGSGFDAPAADAALDDVRCAVFMPLSASGCRCCHFHPCQGMTNLDSGKSGCGCRRHTLSLGFFGKTLQPGCWCNKWCRWMWSARAARASIFSLPQGAGQLQGRDRFILACIRPCGCGADGSGDFIAQPARNKLPQRVWFCLKVMGREYLTCNIVHASVGCCASQGRFSQLLHRNSTGMFSLVSPGTFSDSRIVPAPNL